MGLFSSVLRGGDTFAALRFLRLLTMPFTKTKAYKVGVIDKDGNRLKKPETKEEKEGYTMFHRLVFNIRRLLAKVPFGRSTVASYAAALYLVHEETGLSGELLGECLYEVFGYNPYEDSFLNESYTLVAPGEYTLKGDVYTKKGDPLNLSYKTVTIKETLEPVGFSFGIPVFELYSKRLKQPLLLTANNLISNER